MANAQDDANTLGILWAGTQRGRNADGTQTIFCRRCGRPIAKMMNPAIRTVSKCALCIAREQGVEHPEKYVLPSYILNSDPTQPPIPLEEGDPMEAMYPEGYDAGAGKIPMVGGLAGTVRAVFRAVVGWLGQEEEPQPTEKPLSKKITREKRTGGLFER